MSQGWNIVVTRQIPEAGLALLRDGGTVTVWESELPPSPEQLDALLGDADWRTTSSTAARWAVFLNR